MKHLLNYLYYVFEEGQSWKISPDSSGYAICRAGFVALEKWYL